MAALDSKKQLEDVVVGCFDRGLFSEAIQVVAECRRESNDEGRVLLMRQLKAVAEVLRFGQEGGDERYFMERYGAFVKLVHPDKCRMESKRYCEKAFVILQQCRTHSPLGVAHTNDPTDDVWWDSWDNERDSDHGDSTCDCQGDVEELEALSIDDLKDEVRRREDALWEDSSTQSLEERRQRLVRAREVLVDMMQCKETDDTEGVVLSGTEGGFLA